ncbi:DUF2268 domain-containing putative Zn-dependent protease [Aureimonas psammosilenae]|uniref:DUF2268 domain-containing putative Zn-dependent protease n=1 Tax=Aureimonas psammosilenae TaxID=2495496 RepID=UPI001260E8EB|nr:DUF2268 domain-containing putative Zn-dependent protease [Aureimonas psammosilenae]
MDIRLHFLEAAGSLGQWRTQMQVEAKAVAGRIDALVAAVDRTHSVDVLIKQSKWGIIPELGLGGSCYEAHLVTIAVAPASENFAASMRNGDFGSTLAHELHHPLRHASTGYGATLGEAIVSEGLADHFATEVTGCKQPMWSNAAGLGLDVVDQAKQELERVDYDHPAWFFGRGSLPRWAGYAIGWELVSAYLARHPTETAGALASVNADVILRDAWQEMRSNLDAAN